jgi:hypothetical protein
MALSRKSTASDRVRRISEAIAIAEGFAFPGAPQTNPANIPNSRNNPGNIRDMKLPPNYPVATYATKEDGWNALYRQVEGMLKGSALYPKTNTIEQTAKTYTGEALYKNWSTIVASRLGVSPLSIFSELA